MFLHSLKLRNFLSYGPSGCELKFEPLNILIGANGSGKSNLFEAIALIKSTPQELVRPIRMGGNVRDWLWKDADVNNRPNASVEALVDTTSREYFRQPLRYRFDFTESAKRFAIIDELIEYEKPYGGNARPYFFYKYEHGNPVLNVCNLDESREQRKLSRAKIDPEKSILAQRYDPDSYPEISYLSDNFKEIRIYRDWSFGVKNPIRQPQSLDAIRGHVAEDMSNIAAILAKFKKDLPAKKKFLDLFKNAYSGIIDIDLDPQANSAEIYVQENDILIPATRLSDGTLRFMVLLFILCDPTPPPLICIDEPELGLHPDLLITLHEALIYAAERTQIIITTHSADLVSTFTDKPEYIVICEKHAQGTQLRRLAPAELQPWLKKYDLGTLWMRGELGGTRW